MYVETRNIAMKVNEIYGPVIQGEGKSAGREVYFIRLAFCNLHCTWCDTPYTWNWIGTKFPHPEKFDRAQEIHEVSVQDILSRIPPSCRIVFSGGEPLIQQKSLVELMRLRPLCQFEAETNGTIEPDFQFRQLVSQINCSPKLENSGNPQRARLRIQALRVLSECSKTNFKFVIKNEPDIREVLQMVYTFSMREVYLMAEGRTRIEQEEKEAMVRMLCNEHGFHFSPRLHVTDDANTRGV